MLPVPGHACVSVLCHKYFRVPLGVCVVAGLFPDLLDKPMYDLLHWFPFGRSWGHSLFGLGVATLGAGLVGGRSWALAWFLGHLGHLLSDLNFVPWFFPFAHYEFGGAFNVFDPEAVLTHVHPLHWLLEAVFLGMTWAKWKDAAWLRGRELPFVLSLITIGLLLSYSPFHSWWAVGKAPLTP